MLSLNCSVALDITVLAAAPQKSVMLWLVWFSVRAMSTPQSLQD